MEGGASLKAGASLGSYELVRLLGKGAYAEVWLATERGALGFKKKTALKILHSGSKEGDPHFASLVNEARVCGHLHHPHIVDVYGVGQDEDQWFIAMEFVDGVTLDDLLEQVREADLVLPKSIVLDIGIQVAQALDHAHSAQGDNGEALQIVHRDLKPANIMVARRGGVKVADFGIAKATTNVETTATGLLKGTPCYVAPEVWEGTREFHPRVDLFAVGAILWELAMRRRLFSGDSIAALAGTIVLGSADEEAAELESEFAELAPIVRRLIERKPEHRMQRASRLVSDLREIRRAVDAPGDLDFFFELLELAHTSREKRLERMVDLDIPPTDEPGWSRVIKIVSGQQPTLPRSAPLDEASLPRPISATKSLPPDSLLPTAPIAVAEGFTARTTQGDAAVGALLGGPAVVVEPVADPPASVDTSPAEQSAAPAPRVQGTESVRIEFLADERERPRPWPIVAAGALVVGLVLFVGVVAFSDRSGISTVEDPTDESNSSPAASSVSAVAPGQETSDGQEPNPPRPVGGEEAVPDLPVSSGSAPAARGGETAAAPELAPSSIEPASSAVTDSGLQTRPESVGTADPNGPSTLEPVAGAEDQLVEESPETAPVPDGCIEFRSSPGGATVWLDGAQQSGSAKSKTSSHPLIEVLPERAYVIEMGFQGERAARIAGVTPEPGVRVIVSCDLVSRLACTETRAGVCP